jgi:hypothetical protein
MSDLQLVNVDNHIPNKGESLSDELEYVFVHIDKLDRYGREIIKQNKGLIKFDHGSKSPHPNISETNDEAAACDNHIYKPSNEALVTAVEKEGRRIYNKCSELRDLSTVMEHPEFYKFYLKYMTNPMRLKHMLVLMKMYTLIGKFFKERDPSEESYNAYHKLVFLQKILMHPVYSRILLKHTIRSN